MIWYLIISLIFSPIDTIKPVQQVDTLKFDLKLIEPNVWYNGKDTIKFENKTYIIKIEHTFKFSDEYYPNFSCNPDMPYLLYDKLKDVILGFYKESNL